MTMIIRMTDMYRAGYCVNGVRQFFARYKLDFKQFTRHGISEEELRATGDAMAIKVIEVARGRQQ